ncbi:MAG TPA: hypothetical protein VFQ61_26965 [Polyangiaceae bacterium]|nr:hypothetical protein [Polyangiaceae bacterium]
MRDTSPEAEERYFELMRRQPPAARLAAAARLCSAVRALAEAGIRDGHPGATEQEVRAHLAARMYGREVASRLFPNVNLDGR